jgi:nuclear pore complex protein Nup188
MAVVSNPIAAERFAGEGLLASYSNNSISSAISSGRVDVVMPELPGERSPVHVQYCSMLSIVATVISALGRHNHYFDAEACGFVQLYGEQIVRALRWTVGDTITMPLVEEMEQVVYLFYAIAASVPNSARGGKGGGVDEAVKKVLNAFTTHGLLLLQQINYAVTHPNHLASLFEPVTPVERSVHEKTGAGNGGGDPLKRPLVAHLVHRLFRLSSNIVDTLVCVSKADTVLCASQEDWPTQEALIVPVRDTRLYLLSEILTYV